MKSRVMAGIVAGLLALSLAGCAGETRRPSPTPTPPFASADAAYKAAEATYRGYVDAGNHVDLSDPRSFEPVYAWLLADALKTDREELMAMSAKGWRMRGQSVVRLVRPLPSSDSEPAWGDVYIAGCLDVRGVTVTDAQGKSMVLPTRPDILPVRVAFSRDASTRTGLKIIKIQKRDGAPTC
ncbi:MAG TPA: hypothetical protein VJR25_14980 [Microbacterium sp.]|uniref:hypothetical protein n=1 Tax=Microbacterium sp. TaxID=51671 RepID=UPI002B46C6C1|nr:hypothetical protein [Microbacterium sp.]HKT58064.1 hypothetical protein [Microbacterium sp.]